MKRKIIGALLAGVLAVTAIGPVTAFADSQKVVTLGADLSDEQKNAVMKYFGVLGQNVEILTITNADEREHLGAYVPIEQIGTRTFSCALVNPTTSGGIQVRTANLNWVTGNMIASTLSTSGVKNCEVLAASPFEVSGTGALTGIIMAYEHASGETLDEEKKELATEELVTTGTIADEIGQQEATNVVNDIKMQIIEGQITDETVIENIVENVVYNNVEVNPEINVSISEYDKALLVDLANKIAAQQYQYEDMKETLERVEENVSSLTETSQTPQTEAVQSFEQTPQAQAETSQIPETQAETTQTEASIFDDMDSQALGSEVIQTATDETEATQQPETQPEAQTVETTADDPFANVQEQQYVQPEENAQQPVETVEQPVETVEQPVETVEQPVETVEQPEVTEQPAENTDQPEEQQIDTPQEPETEAPAALELGDVKIYPEEKNDYGETVNSNGLNVIRIDVANSEIVPVSGSLVITNSYGEEVKRVDLADTQQVSAADASDEILFLNQWSEGTSIYVNLGTALYSDIYDTYTVAVQGIVMQDVDGQPQADLSAEGSIAVEEKGLTFNTGDVNSMKNGSTVSGSLNINPEYYAYAVLSSADGKISFDTDTVTSDAAGFNATIQGEGVAEIQVDYYDYEDAYVESAVFYAVIAE